VGRTIASGRLAAKAYILSVFCVPRVRCVAGQTSTLGLRQVNYAQRSTSNTLIQPVRSARWGNDRPAAHGKLPRHRPPPCRKPDRRRCPRHLRTQKGPAGQLRDSWASRYQTRFWTGASGGQGRALRCLHARVGDRLRAGAVPAESVAAAEKAAVGLRDFAGYPGRAAFGCASGDERRSGAARARVDTHRGGRLGRTEIRGVPLEPGELGRCRSAAGPRAARRRLFAPAICPPAAQSVRQGANEHPITSFSLDRSRQPSYRRRTSKLSSCFAPKGLRAAIEGRAFHAERLAGGPEADLARRSHVARPQRGRLRLAAVGGNGELVEAFPSWRGGRSSQRTRPPARGQVI
jgi:hypothetical protein